MKNSLAEQPARPDEAQAQAHAQLDAQAQLEAQEEAQEEAPEDRGLELLELLPPVLRRPEGRTTGTLITFTWMKVLGEFPYL